MRTESLRVFLRVLEAGSYTAAAKIEHITQPAVSSIICSLEEEFGETLLIRSSKRYGKVIPTASGKLFAQYARKALEDYHSLRVTLASQERTAQKITILASSTPSSTVIPLLRFGFSAAYPQIPLHIMVSTDRRIFQHLLDSDCDFCITGTCPDSQKIIPVPFVYDPVVLIAPASYHLGETISFREFLKLPLIMRPPVGYITNSLLKILKSRNISPSQLNVAMEVRENTDVWNVVSQGGGIGFITESLYRSQPNDNIHLVNVRGLRIDREVYISYKKDIPLSPEQELFFEYATGPDWRNNLFSFPS